MADIIFSSFPKYLGDGTIDLDNDTLKCMLLTESYTIDATDTVVVDLGSVEVSGTGYTAGGVSLTGVSWETAGTTTTLDFNDAQWPNASFTARYAVIYDDTPTSPADPLICLFDFGSNQTVSNGTFTIQFNASGVISITT